MSRCIECVHFSFRDAKKMAKVGYGRCSFDPPYRFQSPVYEHECDKHESVDQKTKNARIIWFDGKK